MTVHIFPSAHRTPWQKPPPPGTPKPKPPPGTPKPKPPKGCEMVNTLALIMHHGGAVTTIRDPEHGAAFMAGAYKIDGAIVGDLINSGLLIPDGPRDYRLAGDSICFVS